MQIIQSISKRISEEPVAFQALIQAFLALLVTFGAIQITEQQTGILLAFTAAVLAFFTRRAVTPLANPKINKDQLLVPTDPARVSLTSVVSQ